MRTIVLAMLMLAACSPDKPSYYVRPSEMKWAEEVCAGNRGGLVGLGVTVPEAGKVRYHFLCARTEIVWTK